MNYKLRWSFETSKTALQAIDLFGAKSLDCVKFYKSNKLVDKMHYLSLIAAAADIKAKNDIIEFFKENDGINDYVIFERY